MTDWSDLERELDAWSRARQSATLWWRDDDAVTATPALRRLLDLAATGGGQPVPLAVAAIPAGADSALAQALRASGHAVALQHGHAHANQAGVGAKKAEFGVGRDSALALRELRAGAQRMAELFGDLALPVLVPPWNRIDPALTGRLAELNIRGLSTYGPRAAKAPADGIIFVNTHVDIINWHDGGRFLGLEGCLRLTLGHLRARRERRVDPGEPTGLLSHHLVHDEDIWAFLAAFLQHTKQHPAVRWMDARQLFGCSNDEPA